MTENIHKVVSAIVQDDDRYLLIKRGKPPSKEKYAFPGGRVEDGETLEQAALRELQEETCLEGTNPIPYTEYEFRWKKALCKLSVFKVEVENIHHVTARDDAIEIGWFTIAQARELSMPDNMFDCFERLALTG